MRSNKHESPTAPWWSARHSARRKTERVPAGVLAGRIATEAMHAIRLWTPQEISGHAPTRRGKPYRPSNGGYWPYVPSGDLADLLHNSLGFFSDGYKGIDADYRHADGSPLSAAEAALSRIVERAPHEARTERCAQMIAWLNHVLAPGGWTVEDLHDWAETLRGWTPRRR